jgi:hypothetical protein
MGHAPKGIDPNPIVGVVSDEEQLLRFSISAFSTGPVHRGCPAYSRIVEKAIGYSESMGYGHVRLYERETEEWSTDKGDSIETIFRFEAI